MKNRYRSLMETIRTPAGLNDRVLLAARRRAADRPPARRRRALVRAAVCGACALALALGTLTLRPAQEAEGGGALSPAWSFGLTACAADTGEPLAAAGSGLAMGMGGALYWTEEDGYYTGCIFQVTGRKIETVSLSLDRGELYRYRRLTGLTDDQARDIREAQEAGTMAPVSLDKETEAADTWSTQEMVRLGSSVTEPYDPECRYGLWVDGAEAAAWREDPRTAAQKSVDQLDGACLTVAVTFAGGAEQTANYRLRAGKLRVEWNGDGTQTLLAQWAEEDQPYTYGLLAEKIG